MPENGTEKQSEDNIGRMFAKLTAELEHAHEISVEGQSHRMTLSGRRALLRRLRRRFDRCGEMLATLSETIDR